MKRFLKARYIILVIIILAVGGLYYRSKNKSNSTAQAAEVKSQTLEQTVLATGVVTSDVDLNLSFQASGIVKEVLAKEGDVVKAGQALAMLDQDAANASLRSAEGSLAAAKANYEKVLAGSTNAQILVAQRAVEASSQALLSAQNSYVAVKKQQDTSVANAHRTLLNGGLAPIKVVGPFSSAVVPASSAPTITGFYNGSAEGTITIVQAGNNFTVSGLVSASTRLIDVRSTYPLGDTGLYVQFPSDQVSATWQINIPNNQSSVYVTNYNAYQTAIAASSAALTTAQNLVDSARSALSQAQANLAVVKSTATSAEINVAKAQIITAEGQVAAAEVNFNNTMLKAPSAGTITKVNIKVGEQASVTSPAIILQDIKNLYAEANVSESNIASLKIGQVVDYTFDALGPDRHFRGTLSTINPASTVVSGVVNYKVSASFEDVVGIMPGMTANMTIMVARKEGVLAVPSSAIINESGHKYVRIVDNTKLKTFHQAEVQTGLEADGGLIEITSGLREGQEIVTFMK